MRCVLMRIVLGIGLLAVMVQYPIPYVLGATALVVWLVPRAYRDRREIARLRSAGAIPTGRIAALEADLDEAREFIVFSKNELEDASREPRPADTGRGHLLFRKVGLDQDCPRWVAEVVRREYRKRLHPDGKPPGQKVEAERRFKEMEKVFSEIWEARGF